MSCGEFHSQARELVEQGYAATVVATALHISRSSLYYQKQLRAALFLKGVNGVALGSNLAPESSC